MQGCARTPIQALNLSAARAFALAASSSRFFGVALVASELRSRAETAAISSTAAMKAASFAFDGALNPLIFLTNWSDDARTSSGVAGGSKLKSVLIFLHISDDLRSRKNSPQPRFDHTAICFYGKTATTGKEM